MGDYPTEKDRVVVTGFGPFGAHKVNARLLAVCLFLAFSKSQYLALSVALPRSVSLSLSPLLPLIYLFLCLSWVAVQELNAIGLDDPFVELNVEEVKVEYNYVKVRAGGKDQSESSI